MERTALITGASRGIGAAIARRLSAEGLRVLVAARGIAACEALCAELRAAGGSAEPLALDVGEPESVAAALAPLLAEGSPVDWLVNNAGIAESAPLLRSGAPAEELFTRHLAVNLHGPRRLVEGLVPGMKERGYGRVLNVASSAGLQGYAYVAAYCASKHALVGYTRAAARELEGSGVTVQAICPHYVDSPMLDASVDRVMEKTGRSREESLAFFRQQNPAGELVTPEQVADLVWSAGSSEENGVLWELDGGEEPHRRS